MTYKMSLMLFIASTFLAAGPQILLKMSADKTHDSRWKEYLNPYVLIAYALFTISLVMTIFAYKNLSLSLGRMLDSTTYIFVAVLGSIFLKEKLKARQLIGILLICAGIVVFSL